MVFSAPVYIPDADEEIREMNEFSRVWTHLVRGGSKRVGLLLADVITHPEQHGLGKSVIRNELIRVVSSSLVKAGYIGKPEELRTQEKFRRVLMTRQQQEGGMF